MCSVLELPKKLLTAERNHLSFCVYCLNPFNPGNSSYLTVCEINCCSLSDSQEKLHEVQKSSTVKITSSHSC